MFWVALLGVLMNGLAVIGGIHAGNWEWVFINGVCFVICCKGAYQEHQRTKE